MTLVDTALVAVFVLLIVRMYIDGKAPPPVELVRQPESAHRPPPRIPYEPPTRPTKKPIRFSRGKK